MKDENVINNHMNDLNLISKTHKQLQEYNENKHKFVQLEENQTIHNYVSYIMIFTIITVTFVFTWVKINNQREERTKPNAMKSEHTIIRLHQSMETINLVETTISTTTAPPITEEPQLTQPSTSFYPTLKHIY